MEYLVQVLVEKHEPLNAMLFRRHILFNCKIWCKEILCHTETLHDNTSNLILYSCGLDHAAVDTPSSEWHGRKCECQQGVPDSAAAAAASGSGCRRRYTQQLAEVSAGRDDVEHARPHLARGCDLDHPCSLLHLQVVTELRELRRGRDKDGQTILNQEDMAQHRQGSRRRRQGQVSREVAGTAKTRNQPPNSSPHSVGPTHTQKQEWSESRVPRAAPVLATGGPLA